MRIIREDPRTKEQFLDRLFAFDFEGDITRIGRRKASVVRIAKHKAEIIFPHSGQRFIVQIVKPCEGRRVPKRRPARRQQEDRSFGRSAEGLKDLLA